MAPTDMPAAGGAREVAPQETRNRRGRRVVAGVKASKIGDANSGILRPLAQVAGILAFTLVLDVTSEEGVSEATLEHTTKETIRQIRERPLSIVL